MQTEFSARPAGRTLAPPVTRRPPGLGSPRNSPVAQATRRGALLWLGSARVPRSQPDLDWAVPVLSVQIAACSSSAGRRAPQPHAVRRATIGGAVQPPVGPAEGGTERANIRFPIPEEHFAHAALTDALEALLAGTARQRRGCPTRFPETWTRVGCELLMRGPAIRSLQNAAPLHGLILQGTALTGRHPTARKPLLVEATRPNQTGSASLSGGRSYDG
jgi:hypothetical protein